MKETIKTTGNKRKGFAHPSMTKERLKVVTSMGGKEAHRLKRAHEWTAEEAQEAGRLGGLKSRRRKAERQEAHGDK